MSPAAALDLVQITEKRWKELSEEGKQLIRDARLACHEASKNPKMTEEQRKANAFVTWVLTEPMTPFHEPDNDPYAGKSETIYLPYKGLNDRGINRQRGSGSV